MLTNGAGFYVYYSIHLYQIKKDMRAWMIGKPEIACEVLKMKPQEYEQVQNGEDEIFFNGKLYDIVALKIEKETVFVYCLRDEEEESLMALLDYVLGSPLKDSSVPNVVQQFIGLIFLMPAPISYSELAIINLIIHVEYFFSLQNFFAVIDSPPPWFSLP